MSAHLRGGGCARSTSCCSVAMYSARSSTDSVDPDERHARRARTRRRRWPARSRSGGRCRRSTGSSSSVTASSLRSSVAVRPSRSSYCGSIARRSVPPPRPWHSSAISSPPRPAGRHRLVRARPSDGWRRARRTSAGPSLPLSPSRPIRASGQRCGQPAVPLLHEHTRRHHDEHETAATQRVGGRRDRHVGLAGAGDRLDHAPPAAAQPAHERVELPAVELAVFGSDVAEHESASPRSEHGRSRIPALAPVFAELSTRVLRAPS